MRAFPVQVPIAFALAFLPVACRKPQVTSAASQVLLKAKAPAVAPGASAPDTAIHITGEVNRGGHFKAPLGSNMFFALEPYAGNDSGWSIRVLPGTDKKALSMDCIGAVSEPLHGDNNLSIDPPEEMSEKAVNWKPREFEFVPDVENCKTAWNLMNLVYYPSKLTDEQRTEAGEQLGKIPTAHGKFTVLDSLLRPAVKDGEAGSIEWLKFEVQLNIPATTQNALAQPQTDSSHSGKGIRSVDLQKFLETHYAEVDPNLSGLESECREGSDPIVSVAIQYGDLDGDGQEEAVYQGMTCIAGTQGTDFYGVLKMSSDGAIIALPIKEEAKEFKGRRDLHRGIRGKLGLEIKDGRLLETYPLYKQDDANCCPSGGERDFVYRWDGHQFVLDDIIDIPPKKSGT